MQRLFTFKSCIFLVLLPIFSLAQVGVNTTTPRAMLDISSTNNGVLIPRVALASATDIVNVVDPQGGALETSTLVYNTATSGISPNNVMPGFYYWNGMRWMALGGTTDWTLNGNAAITTPAIPAVYGTSAIGAAENFIGTTDNNDVTFATNTIERMRIVNTSGNVGIGIANPTRKLEVNVANSGGTGIYSENTFAGGIDGTAIYGRSVNFPGFGYGGQFTGGYRGIMATNPATTYNGTTYGVWASSTGTTGVGTRIGGYFTASGANHNYGIVVPPTGGNVGFGTITPDLARFEVEGSVGNTIALFKRSNTGQGISLIGDWPAIHFNSYFDAGIRSMSNGGYASLINTDQSAGGITFQTTNVPNTAAGTVVTVPERMRIAGNGNVGIGTVAPSNTLHVNGTTRLVDGTQGLGKVLTSNATGVATWQEVGIDNVVGILSAGGINIPYNAFGTYTYTGSRIILPPGRYAVNVTMLLSKATLTYSPNNSFFWVRSTFSNTIGSPTPSADIVGSTLASGNFPGSGVYALLTGTIIINNTTAGNRTYYYCAGDVVTNNTTETLTGFGGSTWLENNIIAYRLN